MDCTVGATLENLLTEFSQLPRGWSDDGEGEPISEQVVDATRKFLARALCRGLQNPAVFPLEDGCLVVVLCNYGFSVYADGHVERWMDNMEFSEEQYDQVFTFLEQV